MKLSLLSLAFLSTMTVVVVGSGCANDNSEALDGDKASRDDAINSRAASAQPRIALSVLKGSSQAELKRLYDSGTVEGGIPDGDSRGVAIGESGFFNWFANSVWSGKRFFRTQDGQVKLKNHIGIFGGQDGEGADAVVTITDDPNDKKKAILLDYKDSGMFAARTVVDYMRRVDKGVYLGKAYVGGDFLCYFALDFNAYEDGLKFPNETPENKDKFGSPIIFTGRAFCEDCSLDSIEKKVSPNQRAELDASFYEFDTGTFDGDAKASRSLVILINPTKHAPAHRRRFHIFDKAKFDALATAAADGHAIQLSGVELGPNTEDGKVDSTPYDVGRLSSPQSKRVTD